MEDITYVWRPSNLKILIDLQDILKDKIDFILN